MAIEISPYREEDVGIVIQFNERLSRSGAKSRFPESPISESLPSIEGRDVYMEYFLAKEGNDVRGGYILKHQKFFIKGETLDLPLYKLPISEGIIDKRYITVGIRVLQDALKKNPTLFTVGIGSYSDPVARMLKISKWSMHSVPFYFKVIHSFSFFRNINYLRRKRIIKIILDVLTFTGIGIFGLYLLKYLLNQHFLKFSVSHEQFHEYGIWADELWTKVKPSYVLIAVRDSQTLNILYPPSSSRFIKLIIKENQEIIGWVVLLDTRMINHKQFGNMRVGSIVDSLALPNDAIKIIFVASEYLQKRGVDIIVANYSHSEWGVAFKKSGFFKGPSNFIFAASKDLSKRISPFKENMNKIFMCRGDGDGPINL